MKTLRDLCELNRLPIKVRSANGTIAVVTGLAKPGRIEDDRAVGYLLQDFYTENGYKDHSKMKAFLPDKEHWEIWTEPKPVPHWPAVKRVYRSQHPDGYALTGTLYHSERIPKQTVQSFVRLATEMEAIMLIPSDS